MSKLITILSVVLFGTSMSTYADIVLPQVQNARARLSANPDTYDRVDQYCKDKKPAADCVISGPTFSGGGKGVCKNDYNGKEDSIDLACVRSDQILIDRKLPEGGFVNDSELCRLQKENNCLTEKDPFHDPKCAEHMFWQCSPMVPTPQDQFCQGKDIGSSCVVELIYQGKIEHETGRCESVVESEAFYFWGHRTRTRDVVRCEPTSVVQHVFTPASWVKKILN